jgi:hypothetical protein
MRAVSSEREGFASEVAERRWRRRRITVMPDTDAVRWYRGPGARGKAVGPWILGTVMFGGMLVWEAITSPGAPRVLSLTGAVLVFCAGSVVTVWSLRAAGIGVTADHLIVWDAAATRHLIAWHSVAGFDLEKRWTRGGDELTLVVICGNGRRLHTSGCSFSGTGERSWAAARQMVRALESERQARTPQSAAP